MKMKYKHQRVFTSNGGDRRGMKSRSRMLWTDKAGYTYYRSNFRWVKVRNVTHDIWILSV